MHFYPVYRIRRRGWGFSLAELLVVIGIIALLISILLPGIVQGAQAGAHGSVFVEPSADGGFAGYV